MSHTSIFDIAGPAMVGPSSSHTAGACKIGQFARALFHGTPQKIIFYLHGSFGEVYKGHATDKALLGGALKMKTSDARIKDSFEIAKEKGIEYEFKKKNLGDKYHPNTVKIILKNSKRKMSIIGCSIGGGMIEIIKIDDIDVHIKGRAGKYLSLVVCHKKNKKIIPILKKELKKMNIETTNITCNSLKDKAISILNLDGKRITLTEVISLEKNTEKEGVIFIRSLSKLQRE